MIIVSSEKMQKKSQHTIDDIEIVKSGEIQNIDSQNKERLKDAILFVGYDSISSHPDVVKLINYIIQN